MTTVTLVVPCYNEAQRLDFDAFEQQLERRPDYRLLFVDDGSTDETRTLLESFCKRSERAACLSLPQNQGKGAAVRAGVRQALETPAQYVGYWDADLAAPLVCSEDLLEVLERDERALAVMGVRVKLLGHDVGQNLFRRISGRSFARLVSLALGFKVHDPQCGHKLFRSCEVTARAFAEPFRSRWIFDVEILARLMRLTEGGRDEFGSYVRELPLRSVEMGTGSKISLASYVTALRDFETILRKEVIPARRGR